MTEELIARLQKATGPDRELDVAVYIASGEFDREQKSWLACRDGLHALRGPDPLDPTPEENAGASKRLCPHYTASIDAALTLVPAGVELAITSLMLRPGGAVASLRTGSIINPETKEWAAHAATMPIALCIAALRARAALRTPGEVGK